MSPTSLLQLYHRNIVRWLQYTRTLTDAATCYEPAHRVYTKLHIDLTMCRCPSCGGLADEPKIHIFLLLIALGDGNTGSSSAKSRATIAQQVN